MTDKAEKKAVDYSEGHARSHCGPVRGWNGGDCRHFRGTPYRHGRCAIVKGDIDPRHWCERWAKR